MSLRRFTGPAFFAGAIVWLSAYTARRYNGLDLHLIWRSGQDILDGISPYTRMDPHPYPFKYSPIVAILLSGLQWIPQHTLDVLWFGLGLILMLRISALLDRIFQSEWRYSRPFHQDIVVMSPWLIGIQGLGAQVEGGQMMFINLYLLIKGYELSIRKPTYGYFVMFLNAFMKPQYCAVLGLLAIFEGRSRWRSFLGAGLLTFAVALIPMVFGRIYIGNFSWGVDLYRQWFSALQSFPHAIISNLIGNGNLSLYAYFGDRWHLSSVILNGLTGATLIVCGFWIQKAQVRLLSLPLSIWISFVWSPVSFLYNELTLGVMGAIGLAWAFDERVWKTSGQLYRWVGVFMIALCAWGTSYFLMGEKFFVEVVVPYRLHAWLSVGILLCFWNVHRAKQVL